MDFGEFTTQQKLQNSFILESMDLANAGAANIITLSPAAQTGKGAQCLDGGKGGSLSKVNSRNGSMEPLGGGGRNGHDSLVMYGNPNASFIGGVSRVEGSVEKILNAKSQLGQRAMLDELKDKTGKTQLIIPKRPIPIAPTKAIYCIGDVD
jgi:hypothetical protein